MLLRRGRVVLEALPNTAAGLVVVVLQEEAGLMAVVLFLGLAAAVVAAVKVQPSVRLVLMVAAHNAMPPVAVVRAAQVDHPRRQVIQVFKLRMDRDRAAVAVVAHLRALPVPVALVRKVAAVVAVVERLEMALTLAQVVRVALVFVGFMLGKVKT